MASGSSLSCVYESLTGQGNDDAIPEGMCLNGSVTNVSCHCCTSICYDAGAVIAKIAETAMTACNKTDDVTCCANIN